jgi:hypothetical protein
MTSARTLRTATTTVPILTMMSQAFFAAYLNFSQRLLGCTPASEASYSKQFRDAEQAAVRAGEHVGLRGVLQRRQVRQRFEKADPRAPAPGTSTISTVRHGSSGPVTGIGVSGASRLCGASRRESLRWVHNPPLPLMT